MFIARHTILYLIIGRKLNEIISEFVNERRNHENPTLGLPVSENKNYSVYLTAKISVDFWSEL